MPNYSKTMGKLRTNTHSYLSTSKDILAVYLYGSYAEHVARKDSDLDLAVILNPNSTKVDDYSKRRIQIATALDTLIDREIDLVIFNQVALLLQFLIVKNGLIIYDADPDLRAKIEMKMLSFYYDQERFYSFQYQNLIKNIKTGGLGRGYEGHRYEIEKVRRISEKFGKV